MDTNDDYRLIEAILASGVKIPPMPALLLQVLALEQDDDAGPREFAALIGRDPALSGAVFRIIGSPVLGLRTKVDSLEKAITILGLRTTVAVVRSEGLRMSLNDPELAPVMHTIWQRMNAVADVVLAITRTMRLQGVREDQAFLAGIFHDCGVALLCRRDKEYAKSFANPDTWPDLAKLDAARHTNHAVVGLLVARNWQLPPDVALAVRHHHDSRLESMTTAARKMIVLIQFACHLLAVRSGGDDSEWQNVWRTCAAELFTDIGIDIGALEQKLL
jgi:HD-like signal output (HDOD) protein